MSEFINNQELRQQTIKDIIRQLHEGKGVEEVKEKFDEVFAGVSAREISAAESALIGEGVPIEQVQKLCDVHAAVFKGAIEDIHAAKNFADLPGHPLNVLRQENEVIATWVSQLRELIKDLGHLPNRALLLERLEELKKITIHYAKKENLFFPYMEKYGMAAPPQVMWGVDDQIRDEIRKLIVIYQDQLCDLEIAHQKLEAVLTQITEMIFKEENIMTPILVENLTDDEWALIARESRQIGFLIGDVPDWQPVHQESLVDYWYARKEKEAEGYIELPSGDFTHQELEAMLNTLPFDITFVGANDEVRYFSEGKERAFPRTRSIIGRNVSNCHPPASVHVVEKLIDDFKSGHKDHEDFWIKAGPQFILIRYFALRDDDGKYLGVIEITQNIQPLQEITGEKRLLDE